MAVALIILAAGKGTRMESDLPKVLHKVAGAPLLHHALYAGQSLEPERIVVVGGFGADAVEASMRSFDSEAQFALQDKQLGTGHAVRQAETALDGFDGDAIVLYGDTPFIRPETLEAMLEARKNGAAVVVLGFCPDEPGRYGRLVTGPEGLEKIVEAKDATDEELAISLCNSGVIAAPAEMLFSLLSEVSNDNASGEYYLTDIVGLARAAGHKAAVVTCDEAETLGINSRRELAAAEMAFQSRARAAAMDNGVTLAEPASVYFAFDTMIGRDVEIGPNVVFGPGTTIESGAVIHAFCHLEGCHISRGASVGPFARLRPGAELAEEARVGNFVEIKNAEIGPGAKVNHLSYVGDASIGAEANIGAGTITCNFDGVMKHRTEIGPRSFIGSNTCLVAPVQVGADAMTGTGAVITSDVPDEALALSRVKQVNLDGVASRHMARLKSIKARKLKEAD